MTLKYDGNGEVVTGNAREQAVEFIDRFGQKRVIRRTRHGWRKKYASETPILAMSQALGGIVGAEIKARRVAADLELGELAEMAGLTGIPKSRMWEIENSIRKQGVRLATLYAIGIALGVEARELLPDNATVARLAGVEMEAKDSRRLGVSGR